MIRVATFLWTGGRRSGAALVTSTQVLKVDQTNWCVDSRQTNVLSEVDLLKLQLSPSASHLLSSCLSVSLKQAGCLCTFWTPPYFLSPSVSCLGALFLFPPRLSEPLQRYLSLSICLFCSATSSFSSSVRERGFSAQCGSGSSSYTLTWIWIHSKAKDLEPLSVFCM